ncbi:MAG: hypothetical protein HC926_04965 [Synechococcaceae cyanobacterium SM2_3_60]|nr:hypothetical protein [Synechococcaceae cyanobacterium SM2_3_60]
MQNIDKCLDEAFAIPGTLGVAMGDWKSGLCLGSKGSSEFSDHLLEVAVAGNTNVICAKMQVAEMLNLDQTIEEIMISLDQHYHLIRLVKHVDGLFFYLALDRKRSNLAIARLKLNQIEQSFRF